MLCLYVPSSSISLTRNTHPLYLTQLHRWCMFSTLHLTCIITSVNTLNPSFLTFWTNPKHSFWGQYVMKGPCCFSVSMQWSFSEWPFTWISNVSHFCFTLTFTNQEGRNQTTNLKKKYIITKTKNLVFKVWRRKKKQIKRMIYLREWRSYDFFF